MTKQELITKMMNGKRWTHKYLSPDQLIRFDGIFFVNQDNDKIDVFLLLQGIDCGCFVELAEPTIYHQYIYKKANGKPRLSQAFFESIDDATNQLSPCEVLFVADWTGIEV